MIYYSSLKETRPMRDASDLSGATLAAPAPVRVHAVHVADGQIACGYTSKAEDIAEPDRDWFTVPAGEVRCEPCLDAIQPTKRRAAQ
jgi:hypothetical protein